MAKLRIKGVNSGITFGPPPPPTFDVEADFGTKTITYETDKGSGLFGYLDWGMNIKQVTSALVSPQALTFGPNLVAFTQQTDNPYYSIDTSVFTVDSYYGFYTWLQNYGTPGSPYLARVGGASIEMLIFKYTGISDKGKDGRFLMFDGYKRDSTQWYSPDLMLDLSTDKTTNFTSFS